MQGFLTNMKFAAGGIIMGSLATVLEKEMIF
jgi:hypothetical protein